MPPPDAGLSIELLLALQPSPASLRMTCILPVAPDPAMPRRPRLQDLVRPSPASIPIWIRRQPPKRRALMPKGMRRRPATPEASMDARPGLAASVASLLHRRQPPDPEGLGLPHLLSLPQGPAMVAQSSTPAPATSPLAALATEPPKPDKPEPPLAPIPSHPPIGSLSVSLTSSLFLFFFRSCPMEPWPRSGPPLRASPSRLSVASVAEIPVLLGITMPRPFF